MKQCPSSRLGRCCQSQVWWEGPVILINPVTSSELASSSERVCLRANGAARHLGDSQACVRIIWYRALDQLRRPCYTALINAGQANCVSHNLLDIFPHLLELWGLHQPRASSAQPQRSGTMRPSAWPLPAGSAPIHPHSLELRLFKYARTCVPRNSSF